MIIKRIAAIAFLLLLALPSAAPALPFSYAREHPAACAEAWEKRTHLRHPCGSRKYCAAHKNDDRTSQMVCEAYESKADRKRASIILSGAWLDAARNLEGTEIYTDCVASDVRHRHPCSMLAWLMKRTGATGDGLLPAGMKTAKLALRAHMQVYTFPVTEVRLGIASANAGTMEVTWNRNGNGPRETHSARLTPSEIDRLLAAANSSDFWRLPHWGGHMGPTDGEWAAVELSVSGRKWHVQDSIGDPDAVDLTILVNELNRMIKSRWKDVPV